MPICQSCKGASKTTLLSEVIVRDSCGANRGDSEFVLAAFCRSIFRSLHQTRLPQVFTTGKGLGFSGSEWCAKLGFRHELEMPQQFEFCRVCRQNHNQGRGHRYSNKHKQCLERLQGKMLERVQEIRRSLKNVVPATDSAAQRRDKFWCHFCEQDVIEMQSSFARAQAITHLASVSHFESMKRFWAENGGSVEKQRFYLIEEFELAGWEQACRNVEAAAIRVGAPPLSSTTSIMQREEGSTATPATGGVVQRPILRLSEIQAPSLQPGEGNVHSGAAPPWLKKQSLQGGEEVPLSGVGSSSSEVLLPLSKTQQARLAKMRNPNRVGAAWAERRRAEIEREERGEAFSGDGEDASTWFPNFGRVWQSGPRRDTRREFEAEKQSESQKQRRGRRRVVEKKSSINRTFQFKPYVSKKQSTSTEPNNPPY